VLDNAYDNAYDKVCSARRRMIPKSSAAIVAAIVNRGLRIEIGKR